MAKATGKTPRATTTETSTSTDKPEWLKIEEGVAKAAGGAYGEWQKAKSLADDKRLAFEEAFIAEARKRGSINEDQSFKFAYNFGIAVQIISAKDRRRGGSGGKTFRFD